MPHDEVPHSGHMYLFSVLGSTACPGPQTSMVHAGRCSDHWPKCEQHACRALTEMQHDVKEAREAIAEVADNNAILAAVCLTEGATALDWSTTSHKPLHM